MRAQVRRRRVAVTLAGCVAGSLMAASPVAADPVDLTTFPSVQQAQRFFPAVTDVDLQGYSTLGVDFPDCADDGGREPEAEPRHVWDAGYEAPGRAASLVASLYPFSSVARARTVMRRLRGHLRDCEGLRTGVEDYSRYRRMTVPRMGDERLGFTWRHAYEFEDDTTLHADVWVRIGRTIAVTSARRDGSRPSEQATIGFARLLVRRAR